MPKVGGRRKKHRTHKDIDPEEEQNTPKSFVFRRGRVSPQLKQTVADMRKCMYPNTSMNLQDSSSLKLSSYVRAAKYYKVSHLISFHTKNNKSFVRFIKTKGPALTFRIVNYCRAKDILNNVQLSQPFLRESNAPLLVLNNFSNKGPAVKKISDMLQELFPALNMTRVKPEHLKRVVSFSYNDKNQCVYFRNYRVKLAAVGVSKSIQEILESKTIDFSNFNNFSQYIQSQGDSGSSKMKQTIKLYEVGPRLKLKFFKYDETLNIKQLPQDQQNEEGEENIYAEQNNAQYEGMEVQDQANGANDEQGQEQDEDEGELIEE